MENLKTIEVVVRLRVLEDANIQDLVSEMDYGFYHPDIKETEIIDLFYDEV